MSKRARRTFSAPDGVVWGVEIDLPGSSNAMIIFRHPDRHTTRKDRYNWVISNGPEARSVTSRLDPKRVLESLDDEEIAALFRRSMRISAPDGLLPAPASNS
ncbi:MAG: hypothetical protein ABR499_00675 [Gemmatimonadaceae bacterium]